MKSFNEWAEYIARQIIGDSYYAFDSSNKKLLNFENLDSMELTFNKPLWSIVNWKIPVREIFK